jgi:hypothetical protein
MDSDNLLSLSIHIRFAHFAEVQLDRHHHAGVRLDFHRGAEDPRLLPGVQVDSHHRLGVQLEIHHLVNLSGVIPQNSSPFLEFFYFNIALNITIILCKIISYYYIE